MLGLLKLFIRRDLAELHHNGVRVLVIGDRAGLSPDIKALLEEAEALTAGNSNMNLVIAFNYGARDEIVRAARKIAEAEKAGRIRIDGITPETFEAFLDTAAMPDPDLIIRTSGEQRLSNFLLWQAAYSELVFLPCYWPDFDRRQLVEAVDIYSVRDRRFGGVAPHGVAL